MHPPVYSVQHGFPTTFGGLNALDWALVVLVGASTFMAFLRGLIRSLISSYFGIVRQCIQDLVPKAVMHLLVNFSRESVQNRLVSALYKESLFGSLLEEDETLTNERKRLMELLGTYKEAMMLLSGI